MPVSQVQLIGNLTNVEMSVGNSGKAFTKGSLAVNQGKDANGDDKESLWFNIKAWGDLAENIAETYQNVTNAGGKSMRVVVTGKVIPEKWTDQNGTERTTVSVYLEDLGVSLQYAKVGSVQKSSNPMNSEAFKGAVKKAADIPTPQQTAATSDLYDETGEDGVPF